MDSNEVQSIQIIKVICGEKQEYAQETVSTLTKTNVPDYPTNQQPENLL